MKDEEYLKLEKTYQAFFNFVRNIGVYPYEYSWRERKQFVRTSESSWPLGLQLWNIYSTLFNFLSHVLLVLCLTHFFQDFDKIMLLCQMPWLTGLPLCLAMQINELLYRSEMRELINAWIETERSIWGSGESREELSLRQRGFIRSRVKLYTFFWASSVFPLAFQTITDPYGPSFLPSLNSDAEDKNKVLDIVSKIAYGIGEPYLLHVIYTVTAGFDILLGIMSNSVVLSLEKLVSSPTEEGCQRRGADILTKYKSLQLVIFQLNLVYKRVFVFVQLFLAFLVALCLYAAIQYPYHQILQLTIFMFWNFVCEGLRAVTLFLPLAKLQSGSIKFLNNFRRLIADGVLSMDENRAANVKALIASRSLGVKRGNLDLGPKDVLEYIYFLTAQSNKCDESEVCTGGAWSVVKHVNELKELLEFERRQVLKTRNGGPVCGSIPANI